MQLTGRLKLDEPVEYMYESGQLYFSLTEATMRLLRRFRTSLDAAGYDAPIYAIIGNAGQTLNSFPPKRHHKASWSVYEASEWGFSHLTAHNATHLTLDFYADAPLDATAPLHHSVTIERKFPRV